MKEHPDNPAMLGLDIGTTNCKLIAYSRDGHPLAEASTGYEVRHPQSDFAEIEPSDIMSAVVRVLREIAPVIAECDELSLAISAQGEAFILVDSGGNPLSAAPISIDRRGRSLITEFNRLKTVEDASRSAGQMLNSLTSLAKLLWFRNEASEILEQCVQVLCVGDYVVQQLGISPAMDYSMAARTGLLDNFRLQWSSELIDLAGLSADIFPSIVPSGTLLGTTNADITRQFGLSQVINVYAGGHDQVCAMLGAGVINANTALYSIGTTEAVALTMDKHQASLHSERLAPYPHVIPEHYVALMGSQSGGRVLDWLKSLLGIDDSNVLMNDLPDLPSCITVLPHFAGSGSMLADENARAIISDLGFHTTPQDLTHAVLEGITMEQALALKQSSDWGLDIKRLRAVGGGSRSANWMQIKADITGYPIDCMENPDTACAGAAMLAGMGGGVLASLEEAVARFTGIGPTFIPRKEYTDIYREKMSLYVDIYLSHRVHQTKQTELAKRIETLVSTMKDAEQWQA